MRAHVEEGLFSALRALHVVLCAKPSRRAQLLRTALGQIKLEAEDRDRIEVELEAPPVLARGA